VDQLISDLLKDRDRQARESLHIAREAELAQQDSLAEPHATEECAVCWCSYAHGTHLAGRHAQDEG
jgi:hypothetical protein